MRQPTPIIRFLSAAVLLLASLVIYFGYVRPLQHENRQRLASISMPSRALLEYLHSRGDLPTDRTITDLANLEARMKGALREWVAPSGNKEQEAAGDLSALFLEWGYTSKRSIVRAITDFSVQAKERLGPERLDRAEGIVGTLAATICRAGLGELERLILVPDTDTGERTGGPALLGALEVEIQFVAGLTEAVQFLDEWTLSTEREVLISPLKLTIDRIDPGSWQENLEEFSGPPVQVDLRARMIFAMDNT